VMAAAEAWRTRYDRVLLLLPSWRGRIISPAIEPLGLIDNFGGSEVIDPVSADEFNAIVRSLELGMSVSFISAAAQYNSNIDEGGRTEFSITTFELSSAENLMFFCKLVQYAMMAGGPLVWRELQWAFSSHAREGIASSL